MDLATELAIDLVRDNNKDYYLKTLDFASAFVKLHMRPFSSEDIIEAYYKICYKPKESRVWGAVMRELS